MYCVMAVLYASSRNTRAVAAGLAKFLPKPPNSILTMTMANTPPMRGRYHGARGGKLSPRMTPVTSAERSKVSGFLRMRLKICSEAKQAAQESTTNSSEYRPKKRTPHTRQGSRAMSTSSMMRRVEAPSALCGAAATL